MLLSLSFKPSRYLLIALLSMVVCQTVISIEKVKMGIRGQVCVATQSCDPDQEPRGRQIRTKPPR